MAGFGGYSAPPRFPLANITAPQSLLRRRIHLVSGYSRLTMGLGILEDNKLEHVPGTALLADLLRQRQGPAVDALEGRIDPTTLSSLKHDKSGKLVLVPQPSDSPNDPYNWSRFKKELFCVAFAFGCGAVGAVGPLLNPALVQASAEFGVSLSTFNEGINGALICCLAAGTTILNGLAV